MFHCDSYNIYGKSQVFLFIEGNVRNKKETSIYRVFPSLCSVLFGLIIEDFSFTPKHTPLVYIASLYLD